MYVRMDKFTARLVQELLDRHIDLLGERYDEMVERVISSDRPANGYQNAVLLNTEMQIDKLSDLSTQISIYLKL